VSYPLSPRVRGILRAALTRQRALPQGLARFPLVWHSGTRYSQCPVPDQYDWSAIEGPSRRTLFAALHSTPRPKRWGLALRSSDP
jgi:hypothetical protein